MRNIFTIIAFAYAITSFGQDFNAHVAEAKSSYSSGDLENTRFNLEQALQELDIIIGKEILKQLPTQLGSLKFNEADDNVTSGSGMGTGLFVHRSYGVEMNTGRIDVINNSPLIASLNAMLSIPFVGNSGDGTQKVIKVQGYKAVMNKNANEQTGKVGYTIQIPVNNTLYTVEMDETSESEIQSIANSIPIAKITQMAN